MNAYDIKIVLSATDQASKQIEGLRQNAERHAGGISAAFGGVGGSIRSVLGNLALFDLAMRGLERLVSPVKAIWDQFNQGQAAMAQTESVIRSTGGAAGVTAKQVADLAAAFQKTTTYQDDQVQSAENVLLTFQNIGGNIFPKTTQAVLDFATAMHLDANQAALQVGKALNDPIKGMTTLQREGVTFTESQKDVVKQLIETGRGAEAQKLILDELAKEFGGSASAAATTFSGHLLNLKNQALSGLASLFEEKVLPRLKDLEDMIENRIVPAIKNWLTVDLLPWLHDVGDTLETRVLPVLQTVWDWIQNKLIPALLSFWNNDVLPKWQDFSSVLQNQVVPALKNAWQWIDQNVRPAMERLIQYVSDHKEILAAFAIAIGIMTGAWVAYNVAVGVAAVLTATILSPVVLATAAIAAMTLAVMETIKHWDAIKQAWSEHKDLINLLLIPLGLIPAAFMLIINHGNDLLTAWNNLKSAVSQLTQWIGDRFSDLLKWFSTEWSKLDASIKAPFEAVGSAAQGLWDAIGNPILSSAKDLLKWFGTEWGKLSDTISGPFKFVGDHIGELWGAFQQNLMTVMSNAPDPIKKVLGWLGVEMYQSAVGTPAARGVAAGSPGTELSRDAAGGYVGATQPDSLVSETQAWVKAHLSAFPQGTKSDDLAYMLLGLHGIENPGNQMTPNSAGAVGPWQIIPGQSFSPGSWQTYLSASASLDALLQSGRLQPGLAGFLGAGGGVSGLAYAENTIEIPGTDATQGAVNSGAVAQALVQARIALGMQTGDINQYLYPSVGPGPRPGSGSPAAAAAAAASTPVTTGGTPFTGTGAGDFNTGKEKDSDKPLTPEQAQALISSSSRDLDAAQTKLTNLLRGVSDEVNRITPRMLQDDAAALAAAIGGGGDQPSLQAAFDAMAAAEGKLQADLAKGDVPKSVIDGDKEMLSSAKSTWSDISSVVNSAQSQLSKDQKAYNTQQQQDAQELIAISRDSFDAQTKLSTVASGKLKNDKATVTADNIAQDKAYAAASQAVATEALNVWIEANRRLQDDIQNQLSPTQIQADRDAVASARDAANQWYGSWHDATTKVTTDQDAFKSRVVSELNDLGGAIQDALREQAQQWLDANTTRINTEKQQDADASTQRIQQWRDETTIWIQQLDNRTKASKEALDAQTTAKITSLTADNARQVALLYKQSGQTVTAQMAELDPTAKAIRLEQENDIQRKISLAAVADQKTLQNQLNAMKEEDLNADLQRHVKAITDKNTLAKQALDDQTTQTKQNAQDSLTAQVQTEQNAEKKVQESLGKELGFYQNTYHEMTRAANIEAQARLILEKGNQTDILNLLTTFNDGWKAQGSSFGQRMIDGIKGSGLPEFLQSIFADVNGLASSTGGTSPIGKATTAGGGANVSLPAGSLQALRDTLAVLQSMVNYDTEHRIAVPLNVVQQIQSTQGQINALHGGSGQAGNAGPGVYSQSGSGQAGNAGPVQVHVYLDGQEVTQTVGARTESQRRVRIVQPGSLA